MADPPLVALFGATGLGKTEVAILLAEHLGAEIVVADSMQVYRGLAIVTNQPDAAQRARARHHLVGFVPPQQDYTVAEYAQAAHAVIDDLHAAGRPVVIEGGSGLYMRAALGDLEFAAAPDPELRRHLEERWATDPGAVRAELRRLDPAAAARIDMANPRRVLRALEAVLAAGGPLPAAARDQLWQPAGRYPHLLVALVPGNERAPLDRRIDARVDEMLAGGAADEVAAARRGGPFARTARQAIGVAELLAVLEGELSPAAAAERMKTRTRGLVRRQLTWMRKLPQTHQISMTAGPEAAAAALAALVAERPW